MSYNEGMPGKQRSIEVKEFVPPNIDIVNDYAVPIREGCVIIKIGEGANALYVKQPVVRVKNVGATNSIIKPNHIHIEIIEWFRKQPLRARYSTKFIWENMNKQRQYAAKPLFEFNTIQGRISELLYHKVLELVQEGGLNYYILDRARAEQVLTRSSFNWRDREP